MKQIRDEGIKNPEKYNELVGLDRANALGAVEFALKKIDENLETFTHQFPDYGRMQRYAPIENILWTSSFWTGMLWLAYELTEDEKYRSVAEIHLDSFKRRIEEGIRVDHHDLGFLYSLSCVAAYKLTGNEAAKATALKAANKLTTRYFEKAGIIQAWGDLNDPKQRGRMIIDCNMNLPLLYWASQVTGDPRYHEVAYNHVKQAAAHIVREDASTFHTFYMDVETGLPKYGKTGQGYADDSCWSRGQAWAIYGFALSYGYTGDENLLEVAKKVGNYFLNRLPEDKICYWDLIFTEGNEERDSSAAAIAACGFLEIAKHSPVTDENRQVYEKAALMILKSLADHYTSRETLDSNAVLLHAVGSKPSNSNVDEPLIFGDYYYLEALARVMKNWKMYW